MNRYYKIKVVGDKPKTRSMDMSDLMTTSNAPNSQETEHHIYNNNVARIPTINAAIQDEEQEEVEDGNKDKFNPRTTTATVLKRNSSVSSATSALQSSIKRAFYMRRSSSSVSERYCRIHDPSMALELSPHHEDEDGLDTLDVRRSVKKKTSRSRILKACKKLFGLST